MSTAPGYPYRPLVGSAIRLIRILPGEDGSDSEPDSILRCKLIHMVLDVSPPPQYIALSYVWGSESDRRTVQLLDGHSYYPVSIPSSLWHALSAIHLWEARDAARGCGPFRLEEVIFRNRRPWLVWADALCINQADQEEKALQIPRMGKIFSCATEVLGWLGHYLPPGTDPAVINTVLEKCKAMHDLIRRDGAVIGNLTSPEELDTILNDVENMDRFVETIYAIANLPYFRRLWIIQEYALNDMVMALGSHVFDAIGFTSLLWLLGHTGKWYHQPVELACLEAMGWIRDQIAPIPLRSRAKAFQVDVRRDDPGNQTSTGDDDTSALDKFANRLQTVLDLTGTAPFKATQPHDMIYGLFGLVSPPSPLPSELSINYTQDWADVCRQYAQFIAERTGSVSFLTRPTFRQISRARNSPHGQQNIPTWVPDFKWCSVINPPNPLYITKGEQYHLGRGEVYFSENGHAMTLQGFTLGRPVAFTTGRSYQNQKHLDLLERPEDGIFHRVDAREFLDQVLRPAAIQQGSSVDDVITSWVDCWEQALGFHPGFQPEAHLISRTFRSWLLKGKGPEQLFIAPGEEDENPNGTVIGGRLFSSRGVTVWSRLRNKSIRKNWLVTSDGRGWIATYKHEEVLEDDEIVVLRGLEENPAVLRKAKTSASGDRCYELVGFLIERIPVAEETWEWEWEQVFERGNCKWERITLV